jgi:hypothetical protein
VVLRDARNDRGTQFETAQLDDDGTLRATGHHTRPGVSEFFSDAISCYDWAYVIAPDRVPRPGELLHVSADRADQGCPPSAQYRLISA